MKQKLFFIVIPIILITLWSSCRKDFEYKESTGALEFSKDTVYLDTIFSTIGSSTYSLKVYNRSQEDIQIPNISLRNGITSGYRLNIDGVAGKEFTSVPILAKDSIFIFIETTLDVTTTAQQEFLYTDALQFQSINSTQNVALVTLVKDAIFLYPKKLSDGTKETLLLGLDNNNDEIKVEGFYLSTPYLHFTNEKPYVIYGYAAVPENENLLIDAGTRVHFHENSGIIVGNNSSLKVNGTLSTNPDLLEGEVIFEGDRLEPNFEYTPGQWGTIWLTSGSKEHEINHLTIKNATVGLMVDGIPNSENATLFIKNSQIHNSANVNLWGRTTAIIGENVVLGNAGIASLYCNLGGSYIFTHSTIANYWSNGPRKGPALLIDNYIVTEVGQQITQDLEKAIFQNCIVAGNGSTELVLNKNDSHNFNFIFKHTSIQFNNSFNDFSENPLYNFENTNFYNNIFLNLDSKFILPKKNNFKIDSESQAVNIANISIALTIPTDILGNSRISAPDLGAYEIISE